MSDFLFLRVFQGPGVRIALEDLVSERGRKMTYYTGSSHPFFPSRLYGWLKENTPTPVGVELEGGRVATIQWKWSLNLSKVKYTLDKFAPIGAPYSREHYQEDQRRIEEAIASTPSREFDFPERVVELPVPAWVIQTQADWADHLVMVEGLCLFASEVETAIRPFLVQLEALTKS